MPNMTPIARRLRRNNTKAERLLWSRLRNRQMGGFKFRRQQPIGRYIVDFVSFEKQVIIELDGGHHKNQIEEDKQRDRWLQQQGYQVLRFWDNEVFENLEGVLEVIKDQLLASCQPLS